MTVQSEAAVQLGAAELGVSLQRSHVRQTTQLRDEILASFDALLAAEGFRRRAADHTYRRKVSRELTHVVHLNFGPVEEAGIALVIPSAGVRHDPVERLLVAAGVVSSASTRDRATVALPFAPVAYEASIESGAEPLVRSIWSDWEARGREQLEELSSLELVLRRLSAPDPRDWGHASLGARARLMVLCLLVLGRPNEALEILEQFEHSLGVKDQMLPSFSAFAGWCRSYVQQSGGIAAPAG